MQIKKAQPSDTIRSICRKMNFGYFLHISIRRSTSCCGFLSLKLNLFKGVFLPSRNTIWSRKKERKTINKWLTTYNISVLFFPFKSESAKHVYYASDDVTNVPGLNILFLRLFWPWLTSNLLTLILNSRSSHYHSDRMCQNLYYQTD